MKLSIYNIESKIEEGLLIFNSIFIHKLATI